jgi:CO dehydrogenase nickel-insertion accessory protein CooC1
VAGRDVDFKGFNRLAHRVRRLFDAEEATRLPLLDVEAGLEHLDGQLLDSVDYFVALHSQTPEMCLSGRAGTASWE